MMHKTLLIIFLCLLTSNLIFGKSDITSPPVDTVAIDEITVSAFRYEKKLLDTPGAISIISANELASNAGKPVDDVLNRLPGVYMQSGTVNTNRLTIRGIGSRSPYSTNKIRAYFEGIPLTNGVGETSIEDLNLLMLSKIEVIKGPASGYYGSGLGGTLLFSAEQAPYDQFQLSGRLSSYHTYSQNASLNLQNNQGQHSLYFENLSSDGYRENNQANRFNISYISRYTIKNHRINLILNHTDMKAFIPSSVDLETFRNRPREAASNWAETKGFEDYKKKMAGVSVNSNWIKKWTSMLSLFGHQLVNYELRPFNILQEESRYWGGRFILNKKIKTAHLEWNISLGNESFFEKYDWKTFTNNERKKGPLISNNKENRKYLNFFGQANLIAHEKLHVSFGANINTTNYKYTDLFDADGDQSGKHRFKTIVSPRLAANYPLSFKQRIYANISHGFSPPNLEETLLPGGLRNPNIQPETGWSYELGSRGYLFPGMYYDISVYFMNISNLLVARRVAEDEYTGINAGKTAHPGIEYAFDFQIFRTANTRGKIMHNGSYTPYYFVDFIDDENDYSGNELTGTPKYTSNSRIEVKLNKEITFRLHHQYMGRMPLRDDNSIYSDAYSLLNANASYHKNWKKLSLKITAGAYNLFNKKYASMVAINASSFGSNQPRYYYPGMSRNLSFNITTAYKL